MITERISHNMGKMFVSIVIAMVLLLVVGFATAKITGAKKVSSCSGTYLVEVDTLSEAIWTISQDGTFHGTDSAEKAFSSSHQQGAWVSAGSKRAEATWLNFTLGLGEQFPLGYARVDAELEFDTDCESLTGTLDVWLYESDENPLDKTTGGEQIVFNQAFDGQRIIP